MAIMDRLEHALDNWDPAKRRRFALHLVLWNMLGMFLTIPLYVLGLILLGTDAVLLVSIITVMTLLLSWGAMWLTGFDVVATTDVRKKEDEIAENE